MQRFNDKLSTNLKRLGPIKLIAWGGSQVFLPIFLPYALLKALFLCLTLPIQCIYVSDGLLSPLGWILKRLTGKRVVCNIHGRDIVYEWNIYQVTVCWALKRMDKIICVSKALKQQCINRGIAEAQLHVIPNGVDIEDFHVPKNRLKTNELEEKIGQQIKGRPILLTVGRLVNKKGVTHFLQNIFSAVIKEKPNVMYLIAGDGPLKEKIKTIIREKNWQEYVFLLGEVSMDDDLLPTLYHMADVFVMPNVPVQDDMEGFGIVALEAGAAGLPVIASNVDGISEAVHNGENGFLIDHKNYEKFAKAIIDLLDNDFNRRSFGQHTQEFVKNHYSWKNIATEYFKIFKSLG